MCHSQCFLQRLLKGSPDGHHLADALHGRADLLGRVHEAIQVPSGHLRGDVIKAGLEASRGLGGGVLDFGQCDAERQLGSNEGERITSGFGCKGGRARKTRVNLDDAVFEGRGVQRVLNVAFTNDSEMTHNLRE